MVGVNFMGRGAYRPEFGSCTAPFGALSARIEIYPKKREDGSLTKLLGD